MGERIRRRILHEGLSAPRIITLGFAGVILLGSLLLMLPIASVQGQASFSDALFTSTSAVCVTGLAVRDTGTYWTPFGQGVILCLIQIGGMGVVTVALGIAMASGRRISLMQRSVMQQSISSAGVGGIVSLTRFIVRGVLLIEGAGALLLAPVFMRDFGPARGLWYALFHSVSAFCNAGFDLLGGREKYVSLTGYTGNVLVNVVLMALIVVGGLGFLLWQDLIRCRGRFSRLSLGSKAALLTTAVLLLLPAVYFFFLEFSDLPASERLLASAFTSVTARTAGFNTVELSGLSQTGILVLITLMLIGGSPGSTAGGMKTTTLAVLLAGMAAVLRGRESACLCGRRIPQGTLLRAAAIGMMYLVLFLCGSVLIAGAEGLPLLTAMFESASALGTVGLTLGVTPQLGLFSRGILILLMYAGRVGTLTIVYAALAPAGRAGAQLPQEDLTVG